MDKWKLHHFYNSIPIPKRLKNDILNENRKQITYIKNISKLNIFVGENNSGKSLLLREILKSNWKHHYSEEILQEIELKYTTLTTKLKNIFFEKYISRISFYNSDTIDIQQFSKFLELDPLHQVDFAKSVAVITSKIVQIIKLQPRHLYSINNALIKYNEDIRTNFESTKALFSVFLDDLQINYNAPEEFSKVYCPTTRTLRKYSNTEFLKEKTISEYDFKETINVSNGQLLFEEMKSIMLDDFDVRKKKSDFETFLSEEFFDNQPITITPNISRNGLTFKIGSEQEMPIYDLGEGLQMIILLTFPLFLYEEGVIVIEEPEIFLHPSLQRRLMETLLHTKRAQNFIIFLSTHSNHILDVSNYNENVAIFSMKKIQSESKGDNVAPQFILRQLLKEKHSALELLGVKNTSVFLSNATIWVEGITDMLYIRAFMKNYLESQKSNSKHHICRNYKEGIHYSFVFSGGSNIIHFDFSDKPLIEDLKSKIVVRNLCGRAYVIVDGDNDKNASRKARFFKDLGGRFKVLPTVEIENLLSNEMIENGIKSFSTCKEIIIDPSNMLEEKDYSTIRIGTYIEKYLLKGDKTKGRKVFIDKSNQSENQTVRGKLEFCLGVQPSILESALTSNATKLMKDLFDFLKDVNENNIQKSR